VLQKFSSTVLALLLMGSMLWGQCASCPLFLAAQEPTHGCCQGSRSGHGGMPAPEQPHQKSCPNQTFALENYTKIAIDAGQLLEHLPADAPLELLPESADGFGTSPELLLAHAPPDLYLLNSALLI